jgi:aminodeoxyfutalosine deaminase
MRELISALPKVELHVHLVGSASIDTVLALARRHPERGVPTSDAELRAFYDFSDFAHFIAVYKAVNKLVISGQDVTQLVVGLARDQAASNIRYAEVTVTPVSQLAVGIAPDELAEALEAGRRVARDQHGVELAWIFDIDGGRGPGCGPATLDWVLRYRPEGTVALGLGGPEIGVPREWYRESFAAARDAGLHLVPHAGETTGPETIWASLRLLGAERIGHGTSAVADPALVAHLVEHRIPVEVCPTSNVRTRAVASIEEHPVRQLLAAGVPVTVATDDPGMFHTDLDREYLLCHRHFGLDEAGLTELARTGVRAAFCSDGTRAALLAAIDDLEASRRGQAE